MDIDERIKIISEMVVGNTSDILGDLSISVAKLFEEVEKVYEDEILTHHVAAVRFQTAMHAVVNLLSKIVAKGMATAQLLDMFRSLLDTKKEIVNP